MNVVGMQKARLGVLAFALFLAGCAAAPTAPESTQDNGRHAPAVDAREGRADVDPEVRADFETALRHLRAGEYERGAALLREVIERAPDYAAPHVNLAIAYQKLGKLPAAEESAKRAVAAEPENPVANTEYGLILRKVGRFADARQAYERALARYPDFLPARKNLGILCDIYLRDFECALEHYRRYSAAMPDDENVRIWIADLERRMGKANP